MPRRSKEKAAPQEAEVVDTLDQAPNETEQLRASLSEAEERADRYYSNWQRSAADFQNWKRRADQEKIDASKLAEGALTGEILSVLDDFERAFQSIPAELRSLTWIQGVALIWQKLFSILQMRGLSPIEAQDKEFDPYLHEAVLRDEDGAPEELTHVVAELQRGYRFHDRVLRPTLVKVGRPPQAEPSVQPSGPSEDEAPPTEVEV